jgi:hypothetical protein
MTKTTVIDFTKPSDFSSDPLTDLLRAGGQELLATAARDRGASPFYLALEKIHAVIPPLGLPRWKAGRGWFFCGVSPVPLLTAIYAPHSEQHVLR